MNRFLIAVASILLAVALMGCGDGNLVGPGDPGPTQIQNAGDRNGPSQAQYYEPTYIGEPHRGTDPDLGPTG